MGQEKGDRYDATIDVGIIAIALIENPAQNDALSILEQVLKKDIKALIPLSVILGAYYVLVEVFRADEKEVAYRLSQLVKSKNIDWFETIAKHSMEHILRLASEEKIDSWDAYLVSLMQDFDINTVYTTDVKHFSKFSWLKPINPIPLESWAKYNEWIGKL